MHCPFDHDDDLMDERIDLTPLIDAVFLLLIFFIMATTFLRPALEVSLPDSESAATLEQQDWLVITIAKDGNIYHGDDVIPRPEVAALLQHHPDKPLNFYVDKHAPFESFAHVVDQAQAEGRVDFVVTTLPHDRR
ncbi:ExbD/TolR family protein [Desulfurispira natronophila]|uniref:Biopolymer transport protein ExbD n=1 Tax=Desulfurispira natronophila TaxID=682562 RepID=A0A7W7Y3U9_9BACT|nr:biopolymer transporter ExbD [Desulfurispira natronophila]MBB5021533.1 biopolymer transport protein ExbD [Desulfurispira natronophila]